MSKRNARVFLDVLLPCSKEPARLICELFTQTVPLTSNHFRSFFSMGLYTNCEFHRCIEDFMIQLGDHSNLSDMPSLPNLEKEGLMVQPKQYHLMMANDEEENPTNQFFILTTDAPHLFKTHVVFGIVISGFDTVHAIERTPVDPQDRPLQSIVIVHSGELIKQPKLLPPSSSSSSSSTTVSEIQPNSSRETRSVENSQKDSHHLSFSQKRKISSSRCPSPSHRSTSSIPSATMSKTLPHKRTNATSSLSSSSSKSITADIYASLFGSSSSHSSSSFSSSSSSSTLNSKHKKRKLMVFGDRYDLQGRKIKGRGVSKYKPL